MRIIAIHRYRVIDDEDSFSYCVTGHTGLG